VPKLSVTIITLNEAANIEACLASVDWVDDVLVVDSGSTDGTADLARAKGARVVVRDWPGYAEQKNFAAGAAAHDWILSVDADERVTPDLRQQIQQRLAAEPAEAGFRMPRVTWHLGRWIRTTDWYPRLSTPALRSPSRRPGPHGPCTNRCRQTGPVGRLTSDLQHFAYRDLQHHFATMDRYTTLAAEDMRAQGRRAGVFDLTMHPWAAFMRNYVLRRGFMDGTAGFVVSTMNAYYVFLKFAKLWAGEPSRSQRPPAQP
jgi:glycosyltransferase involved in cell wall biosynthesis